MNSTLNSELLSSMIKSRRGKMGLRETATAIGKVSPATLSRIERGYLPDVETFLSLCAWLGVTPDLFMKGAKTKKSEVSEKELIIYQLRASKQLDPETIDTMIQVIRLAFTKAAKNGRR